MRNHTSNDENNDNNTIEIVYTALPSFKMPTTDNTYQSTQKRTEEFETIPKELRTTTLATNSLSSSSTTSQMPATTFKENNTKSLEEDRLVSTFVTVDYERSKTHGPISSMQFGIASSSGAIDITKEKKPRTGSSANIVSNLISPQEANDFINKKLVEIFCNINLNEVDSIPLVDFNRILEVLDKAFKEKFPLIKHFELGGVEFGFIPKLDDMSLGEYVDVEATISDWQNIHKAMSVLFRPVNFKSKDKYTIAPYKPNDDIKEWMKQMPLSVVMGCMVFFYDLGNELSRASLAYLEREMKKDKTSQLKEALEESGVGISQFMDSVKETSQSLTKLEKNQFLNVSLT